jgi:hypothetical protein
VTHRIVHDDQATRSSSTMGSRKAVYENRVSIGDGVTHKRQHGSRECDRGILIFDLLPPRSNVEPAVTTRTDVKNTRLKGHFKCLPHARCRPPCWENTCGMLFRPRVGSDSVKQTWGIFQLGWYTGCVRTLRTLHECADTCVCVGMGRHLW